ncbi:MAG: trypsin-like peptidase domain-containing protein [Oscillospiraceae bacterium]|nr:trypsin-like peptidase domain-containing protein [Oscillospiraceae bacterium]
MINDYNPEKDNERQNSHPYIPIGEDNYWVLPVEPSPGKGGGRRKGSKSRIKWIAVCLACAVVGGLLSSGIFCLWGGESGGGGKTTLQMGQREAVKLNTSTVSTGTEMTFPEVYAKYVNSTVGIITEITSANAFGQPVEGAAAGSGFIISADGYILTNYHVVENAKTIQVTLGSGAKYSGRLVGYDDDSDVAVLKVSASSLNPVVIGDSDKMHVADAVMAIGNPLGDLTFTCTTGIVSALNRSVTINGLSYNMMQTDCAINEGNSGGPLFNKYGEVVGIVSAKYASSQIEGLGFAIPINDVTSLVSEIIKTGYVTGKASMGITVTTISSAMAQQYNMKQGAYVVSVGAGSCAEKAGLKQGDIITAIGKTAVNSTEDLASAKKSYKAGQTATITIYRSGEAKTLNITFDEEKLTSSASNSGSAKSGQSGSGSYGYSFGNGEDGSFGFQLPGSGEAS